MNSLLDDDEYDPDRKDRELTLGTGMILGIFFALLLLCGLFFGFGYKIGSHKTAPAVEAAATNASPAPAPDSSGFKPSAGSLAVRGSSARVTESNTKQRGDDDVETETAPIRVDPRSSARAAAHADAAPAADAGTIFVQVAAVSHQEDAELLVNALRAKGYPVSARTQPKDQFYHIQVGPFATLQAAGAAKQRLLADGYQPIIK